LATASRALSYYNAAIGRGEAVRVHSFMGLDPKCRWIVSRKDNTEKKDLQWKELCYSIQSPTCVLLFHLHNHYALISGWRELDVDCLSHEASPSTSAPATSPQEDAPVIEPHGGTCRGAEAIGAAGETKREDGDASEGREMRVPGEQEREEKERGESSTLEKGRRRQILTARVGQTLQHWVDFDDDFTFQSAKTHSSIVRNSVCRVSVCLELWLGL